MQKSIFFNAVDARIVDRIKNANSYQDKSLHFYLVEKRCLTPLQEVNLILC